MLAASIRQRLRDGDFQTGDRVVVTVVSDVVHKDTLVVRSGRILELPDKIVVPVTGVLRSELQDLVSSEVLKYVKARQIEVTPLMRVGVLGEVGRPGYFAFASDLPITDAIMGAGGPTAAADLEKSIVRRGNQAYRSAEETGRAIGRGLTLDQFGLNAGDEIVVGRRRDVNPATIIGMVGALGSVVAVFLAVHNR
jgi:protein involved in polysaccharide export with SLBB domain